MDEEREFLTDPNLPLVNLTEFSTHYANFTVPKEYVIKAIDYKFNLENVVSSKIYKNVGIPK